MSNLFKDLLKAKHKGDHLFPALREDISKEQEEDIASFEWRGYISPSAQLTYNMCPVQFIEKQKTKTKFILTTRYKMLIGRALHLMVQNRITKRLPHLLWDPPNIENEYAKQKLASVWPEVPIRSEEFGVSGRIDFVLRIDGQPVIVDLKTTGIVSSIKLTLDEMKKRIRETFTDPTTAKVKEFCEWLISPENWQESWNKDAEKYPSESYEIQVGIYAFLCNRLGYYSVPIRKVGLAVINLCIPFGEPKGEKEVYWPFTVENEKQIERLLYHINIHRLAALANETKECQYPLCKVHAKLQVNENGTDNNSNKSEAEIGQEHAS